MNNKYHQPGLGEVHSEDHKFMIYCEEIDAQGNQVISDRLAVLICNLLNKHFQEQAINDFSKEFGGED